LRGSQIWTWGSMISIVTAPAGCTHGWWTPAPFRATPPASPVDARGCRHSSHRLRRADPPHSRRTTCIRMCRYAHQASRPGGPGRIVHSRDGAQAWVKCDLNSRNPEISLLGVSDLPLPGRLPCNRTDRRKSDMPTRTASNPSQADAHRRARAQERVAIGMAVMVLVATAVVANASVAGGMSPLVSRTEAPADQCLDGSSISRSVCPSGPPTLPTDSTPSPLTTADVSAPEEFDEELGPVLQGIS